MIPCPDIKKIIINLQRTRSLLGFFHKQIRRFLKNDTHLTLLKTWQEFTSVLGEHFTKRHNNSFAERRHFPFLGAGILS
jgi:hypothetical protein